MSGLDPKQGKQASAALTMLAGGYNCAQSIVATFGPDLGMPRDLAIAASLGLGAGFGRQGEVCGAVAGAFVVLGLRFPADKIKAYAAIREFTARFKARHGSIHCRDLVPYDLSTEEGLSAARASGVFIKVCPELVRAAARLLEETNEAAG